MSETSTIAAAKRALRDRARAARAGMTPERRREGALALARTGLSFLTLPWAAVVAGYHPMRDEIDPLPLLRGLDAGGIALALPAHAPGSTSLSFHRWRPGDALVRGDYGVHMPPLTAPRVEPDVVLLPLLAFDAEGHRLGYGAGYFDRAIARLRALRPVVAVGVGFDEQEFAAVPHEPWDQPLDWVLTPRGPRLAQG